MAVNPIFPANLEAESSNKRYLIRVLTPDLTEQKTFSTNAKLQEAIKKANQYGCDGTKLILALDGCELIDDEVFLYYIVNGAKFMIVNCPTEWHAPKAQRAQDISHKTCICVQQKNAPAAKKPTTPPASLETAMQEEQHNFLPCSKTLLAEERFKDVDISWSKLPIEIREAFTKGEPLERKVYILTKHIVQELRTVSTNIPIRVLRMLAHRLVARYPKCFQNPVQQGDMLPTVLNLALAMRHHNNFLNRSEKSALKCCDVGSQWQEYIEENAR